MQTKLHKLAEEKRERERAMVEQKEPPANNDVVSALYRQALPVLSATVLAACDKICAMNSNSQHLPLMHTHTHTNTHTHTHTVFLCARVSVCSFGLWSGDLPGKT